MSAPPLVFRELAVRRMPGFPRTGFRLDDLGPGINIVHGPNASGKTTTATALNLLLWPRRDSERHASLYGRFELDGHDWSVDLDAGRVLCQRAGADADPPLLPSDDFSERYNLPLHELLSATNRAFAETVRRESAGGYDVEAAKAELGFRDGPSAPRQLAKAVNAAQQALRVAQREQEALWQAEQRLAALNVERQRAATARCRAEVIQLALDRVEAAEEHQRANTALAAFPHAAARITGTEMDELAALRNERRELEREHHAAELRIQQAEQDIVECGLAETGVGEAELVTLRECLQDLQAQNATVRTAERERDAARTARDQEARRIGDAAHGERLEALDAAGFDDLAEFARQVEQLRGRRVVRAEMQRWFGKPDAIPDIEILQDGRRLLLRWLRADARVGDRRTLWLATGAGVIAASTAAILAVWLHWAWLGLAVVVLALGGMAWWPTRGRNLRAMHRSEYRALPLDPPAEWAPAAVLARVEDLDRVIVAAALDLERVRRREEVEAQAEQDAPLSAKLAAQRESLITRLGVAPDINEAKLFWLAERVSAWHDAARVVYSSEALLDSARRQSKATLDRVHGALRRYDDSPITDVADLRGRIEELDHRRQRWNEARARRQASRQRRDDLDRQLETLDQRRQAVFTQRGLTAGDEALLDECCRSRNDYLAAKLEVEQATGRLAHVAERLRGHPQFKPDLDDADVDALRRELHQVESAAARWDDLNREIIEIQTRVNDAKRGHDVEAALAELARSEAALTAQRDSDCAAAVGAVIAGFIEQQSREDERPAVFRRARKLFAKITRGRYRLDMTDDDVPEFRAVDENEGTGHALDELSSATRVQLLLAVRVAFVEMQEQGIRLPLFLDELLANSDDVRAAAIIDAVLAVAATGRQVFYFTAQPDEVGKWLGALRERTDVRHQIIDLARARGLTEPENNALAIVETPTRTIPAPGAMSHEEYGRALHVPAIDPRADGRAAHVWYLIDDPHVLHRLLTAGVERWGQLQSLLAHDTELLDEDARLRAKAAASVITAVGRSWRIGRGRPVDRRVLLAAGVTDAFIDSVSNLAAACDGEASALLGALEKGRVKRFRTTSIASLRDHFAQAGHLDDAMPLSAAEIRRRAHAIAARYLQTGHLAAAHLERILDGALGPAAVAAGDRVSATTPDGDDV